MRASRACVPVKSDSSCRVAAVSDLENPDLRRSVTQNIREEEEWEMRGRIEGDKKKEGKEREVRGR